LWVKIYGHGFLARTRCFRCIHAFSHQKTSLAAIGSKTNSTEVKGRARSSAKL
jgi:hypothetical protein